MAKVIKCDRCNKRFTIKDHSKSYNSPIRITIKDIFSKTKEDLCPNCTEEFFKWMYKEK